MVARRALRPRPRGRRPHGAGPAASRRSSAHGERACRSRLDGGARTAWPLRAQLRHARPRSSRSRPTSSTAPCSASSSGPADVHTVDRPRCRSPTTASSATPVRRRSWRPTVRSTGGACRDSMIRRCSGASSAATRPDGSRSVPVKTGRVDPPRLPARHSDADHDVGGRRRLARARGQPRRRGRGPLPTRHFAGPPAHRPRSARPRQLHLAPRFGYDRRPTTARQPPGRRAGVRTR